MPKAQVEKPYVSFIGGLWTESSPLSHPENTSQVEQNFKLNPDGSRERRLGLVKEDDIEHDDDHDHRVEIIDHGLHQRGEPARDTLRRHLGDNEGAPRIKRNKNTRRGGRTIGDIGELLSGNLKLIKDRTI